MSFLNSFALKTLKQNSIPRTNKEIIIWWESRRLIFNAIFLFTGIIALCLLVAFAKFSPFFGLGLLIFLIVGMNVFYCLGWMVEIFLRMGIDDLNVKIGPLLWGITFIVLNFSLLAYSIFEIINRI